MHVTLDASFHELESYYSGELFSTYFQGESSNEDNVLLESGGVEFIEPVKMSERLVESESP